MADYSRSFHHNGGTTIYQTRKLEKPSKRVWFSQNSFWETGSAAVDAASESYHYRRSILELTKRGAGMTTLFLLVTGVCQSLNE